jgi:ATP-dependent protease ClpP protease subunit
MFMKTWFEIKAKASATPEILLFDDIGYGGLTAKNFINEVKALGDVRNLTVRINSLGGDLFDGLAIYNFLQFFKKGKVHVNVVIDGVAASIASVIAMSGDTVRIPENAFIFIHNPWGLSIGDSEDMREYAELLDRTKISLIAAYRQKTKLEDEKIAKLMDDSTWLMGQEAKDLGFADEVITAVAIAARADNGRCSNLPAALKNGVPGRTAVVVPLRQQPNPAPSLSAHALAEIESRVRERGLKICAACNAAGVPELALELFESKLSAEQVEAQLADASAIRAACNNANLAHRAVDYLKRGIPLSDVHAELGSVTRTLKQLKESDESTNPSLSRLFK